MRAAVALLALLGAGVAHAGVQKLEGPAAAPRPIKTETPQEIAARCTPVNLRSTLGPARDQSDLSWCYAFTAADMLSQALRQEKSGLVGLTPDGILRDDLSALQVTNSYQRRRGQNLVDNQNQGRMAGIGFRSAFMMDRPGHRYHAVGIIGRKMINGKCNYLIRDSYGPGCRNDYHPEYRKRCRNGETWVEEDALIPNVATVSYIPASAASAEDWRARVKAADLTPAAEADGVQ